VGIVETELACDQPCLIMEVGLHGSLLSLAKTRDIGLLCADQVGDAVQTIDKIHT